METKKLPNFSCKYCDGFTCENAECDCHLLIHIQSEETKKGEKGCQKFLCKTCDYFTCKKSLFDKHLLTRKHIKETNETKKVKKVATPLFMCDCGIEYKCRQSLWRHKKKCINENSSKNDNEKNEIVTVNPDENKILANIVVDLMKQNQELIELMKNNIGHNTVSSHNTTNSHNKTFNLQFFLNETCKDAMNIMDFVNSMEIELDDLEKVGELGYVNGMTNIILKNLKALDITKRPLHCTDAKREIMYIKDENKWEKETENKDKIKKALKYIMHKNAKMLNVFKEKYPDCIKSYSKRSDQYNKLVIEVLGGRGDNEPQHNEKIIRRIAREVTIDKGL